MRTMTQTRATAYINTMAQYLKDLIILHPETKLFARITTCPCIFPLLRLVWPCAFLVVFPIRVSYWPEYNVSSVTIKSVSHFDASKYLYHL